MTTISSSVYAENSEILYSKNRFDTLYQSAQSSLEDTEDISVATSKIIDYLDKVNLIPCNGFKLLVDLEQKTNGNNGKIYQKINDSCESFNAGDYKNGFKILESIGITNYSNDLFLYSILRFYEISLDRIHYSGYKPSYDQKENLDFLLKNKDYLISKLPITYGTRLAGIYYVNQEVELFNTTHNNFLTKDDYFLKIILETYYFDLNGGQIDQIAKLLKYENLITEFENGTLFRYNTYLSIYGILFQESLKTNDKKLIIKYFFNKEDIFSDYKKLYTKDVVDYFNKLDNLSLYKDYIIENIASIQYREYDKTESATPIKDRAIHYFEFLDAYDFLDRFIGEDYIISNSAEENIKLIYSLGNLFAPFNDPKRDMDSTLGDSVKKLLIKSIEKVFAFNKAGTLLVSSDLSDSTLAIIQAIPELKNLSSKDLKIISSNENNTSNEKNTFSGNYTQYILLLLVFILLLVIIFQRKRG